MAKAPRAGDVKTRLCPPLSAGAAADLARACLLDTIESVRALGRVRRVVAFAPDDAGPLFRALAPDFGLIAQRGPDLGARMAAVFEDLLARGAGDVDSRGAAGAILVGSDIPTLPPEHLADAVRRVRAGADVVLGPSEDGGYHLIGLRAVRPELFEGMAWSTSSVLPETLRRARAGGLRAELLPAWFDVDTGADLARLEADLEARPGPGARHTRAFFSSRRQGTVRA